MQRSNEIQEYTHTLPATFLRQSGVLIAILMSEYVIKYRITIIIELVIERIHHSVLPYI